MFYVEREITKRSDVFVEYGAPITIMVRSHVRYFTSALPGALLRDNKSTSILVSV